MRGFPRRLLLRLVIAGAALVAPLVPTMGGDAAYVSWGNVLVPGSAWAGSYASWGDLNVYSNGDGQEDVMGGYGLRYECVELATRWAAVRFGEQPHWPVAWAYEMYDVAPRLQVPLQQLANGGAVPPQAGDLLVFDHTAASVSGHVAVVFAAGPGYVDIVEQNWANSSPTGHARLPISGATMPARYGLPIRGWLRPARVAGSGPGGYFADAYGGVHNWGSAAPAAQLASFGSDMVRGIVRLPGRPGGYVVDAHGGVHAFGNAPALQSRETWSGDLARGIALRPTGGGYVVDAGGALHSFGSAPAVVTVDRWRTDLARAVALRPDGNSGYVLDAQGGLHAFGGAPVVMPSARWASGDVARALVLDADGNGGYVVDVLGGLHPFGSGTVIRGRRVGVVSQNPIVGAVRVDDGGGYLIDSAGALIPYGDQRPVLQSVALLPGLARGVS